MKIMNSITFRRRELVWDVYETTYTKADWETLMEWVASHQENEENKARYAALKDVDFDQVCAILNGDAEDIEWSIHVARYNYTYTESLTDFIKDMMREDAWNCGAIDSYGADDSEEELDVYLMPESENVC